MGDFGMAATLFLQSGAKPAVFKRVATRLGCAPEDVERAVAATARVFLEAARAHLVDADLVATLREAGLSAERSTSLAAAYAPSRDELQDMASRGASALPLFHGIEWRLEVEVAARGRDAGGSGLRPSFLLRLDTVEPPASGHGASRISTSYAQADYAALRHLKEQLELAVAELDSGHARRVQRYVR